MKSMLFATMYVSHTLGLGRYNKYLACFQEHQDLGIENLVFLDDGSDPELLKKMDLPTYLGALPSELPPVSIITFAHHKGRPQFYDFQGWWRSYQFAPKLADHYKFERLIHIESDARVISGRLWSYLMGLTSGWTALWCPRHRMPETAIQVICKDQYENVINVVPKTDTDPERYLPFTKVEKDFKGDRYGEFAQQIPHDADYACQIVDGGIAQ